MTACASNGDAAPAPAVEQRVAAAGSLSGNYLAARHAQSARSDDVAADFLLAALAKSPNDPFLLQRAHNALLGDGRVAEAAKLALRMPAADQGNDLPSVTRAVDAIKAGRYAEVASILKADGPTQTLGVLLRAWSLQGAGRTDQALAAIKALKTEEAGPSLYHLHAALLNDAAGRKSEAAALARAVVEGDGVPPVRTVQLVGAILVRAGAPDEAKALYDRALDGYGADDTGSLAELLQALPDTVDPAKPMMASAADGAAEALFQASGALAQKEVRDRALMVGKLGLYLKPNFPFLQMFVAELLDAAGRPADANRLYAGIDRSSPVAWQARLARAENLNRMDQFAEAEKELRAMVAERPDDPHALLLLGDMLRQRERFVEAVPVYDAAIALKEPLPQRYWRVLYARGIALERAKLWERAEADFLRALELEPDQPLVLNYLGYSWVEQGTHLEEAQDMIRRAVGLRPNDGFIVDSLGWVYYRLGKNAEAVVQLERAVELQPEDPVINDHLGDAYLAVGRQREAHFQWRAALALDPEPQLKAELERKLQGVIREASATPQ
jgi:tetratricopeptide (TPR) repeat protein